MMHTHPKTSFIWSSGFTVFTVSYQRICLRVKETKRTQMCKRPSNARRDYSTAQQHKTTEGQHYNHTNIVMPTHAPLHAQLPKKQVT
jgi:hypothetical protein